MTFHPFRTAACAVLVHVALAGSALAQGNAPAAAQEITRAGAQASEAGPAELFTGGCVSTGSGERTPTSTHPAPG